MCNKWLEITNDKYVVLMENICQLEKFLDEESQKMARLTKNQGLKSALEESEAIVSTFKEGIFYHFRSIH